MPTDRSGRTYEEYRQLYWDNRDRVKVLEATIKRVEKVLETPSVGGGGHGLPDWDYIDVEVLAEALQEKNDD
jgi:hypothetical protein